MIFEMDNLICQFCKKYFNEPKFLPCGENACSKCLPESGKFDCVLCAETHSVPENGFPSNKILSKALEKNFKSDEYDPRTLEFRKNIEDTEKKFGDLKLKIVHLETEVIEHCDSIVNEIDLIAEEKINQINNIRDDLVQRVDEYQDKCLKNLTSWKNYFANLSEKFNLVTKDKDLLLAKKDFDEKLDNYYNTLSIVELGLNKIRHLSLDFRNFKFNSSKSNLDNSFLGLFSNENLKEINSNVLMQFKADPQYIPKEIFSAKLNRLENGNFIFSFIQAITQKKVNDSRELSEERIYNENRINQVHYYQMNNQLKSQAYIATLLNRARLSSHSVREEAFKENYKFIIRNLSSLKTIEISIEDKLSDLNVASVGNFVFLMSFKSKYIKKYDVNFSLLKTVNLLESASLMLPAKKFILVHLDSNLMNVYDMDLNFLITITNNDYNSFLHIPNKIKKAFINDKYYFFQEEDNSITVVNQDDGKFFKKIIHDGKKSDLNNVVKITNDFIIIAYNVNKFEFRNTNGELFYEKIFESNNLTFLVEDQNTILSLNNLSYQISENKF